MHYSWNWGLVFASPYLGWFINGIKWTLLVSLASWIIAFIVGSGIGIARTSPGKLVRTAALAYVSLFRNIPLIVQMFLWFFVLPEVLPAPAGRWLKRDLPNPEVYSAIICLGLFTAARVAEQVRSGIQAIGVGQMQAALALGLTRTQTYRDVLLPNAYRIIVPVLTSEFLTIFKNSSVALTVGVAEVTAQSRRIAEHTFHSYEAYAVATAIYVVITSACIIGMRVVERQTQLPGVEPAERKVPFSFAIKGSTA